MTRWLPLLFGLTLGIAVQSGCAVLSSDTSPTDTKNALTLHVREGPAPEKQESDRPSTPGYGFIWVNGYWDYLDGNYIWRRTFTHLERQRVLGIRGARV